MLELFKILFFLTFCILQAFTWEANLNDLTVSLKQSWKGETLTNISVLELPPRLGMRRCVSLEFLYGMCSFFCTSAKITLLSSLSDRLMFLVSSMRVLVFGLSEPARSTKLMEPILSSVFSRWVPISWIFVTACDRDDRSFPAVQAVARFDLAIDISCRKWFLVWTVSSMMFDT